MKQVEKEKVQESVEGQKGRSEKRQEEVGGGAKGGGIIIDKAYAQMHSTVQSKPNRC